MEDSMEDLINKIMELGVSYGGKLLLALLVGIVGSLAIKTVKKMVAKALDRDEVDKTLNSL